MDVTPVVFVCIALLVVAFLAFAPSPAPATAGDATPSGHAVDSSRSSIMSYVSTGGGGPTDLGSGGAGQAPRSQRALLIGINYVGVTYGGESVQLGGCVDDVRDAASALVSRFGFAADAISVMTDDTPLAPTKTNLVFALASFASLIPVGGVGVVWYSGHGTEVQDATGRTEMAICPLDFPDAGMLSGSEVRSLLADNLQAGAKLFVLTDSCHSATLLELHAATELDPFAPRALGRGVGVSNVARLTKARLAGGARADHAANLTAAHQRLVAQGRDPAADALAAPLLPLLTVDAYATTVGDIVAVSGCLDEETSADTYVNGEARGACSWAVLQALAVLPSTASLNAVVVYARAVLREASYTQTPSVSIGNSNEDMSVALATYLAPVSVA